MVETRPAEVEGSKAAAAAAVVVAVVDDIIEKSLTVTWRLRSVELRLFLQLNPIGKVILQT